MADADPPVDELSRFDDSPASARVTWSLLAREPDGRMGIAIASRFFSVGALCMHSAGGVGVLATQALMNPLYGAHGIALLAAGEDADEVVRRLTGADAGQTHRQLHLLPARGPGAAHTGARCIDWCGHELHPDFSVAGNMLAGPQVVQATARAFIDGAGLPLAERMIAAMNAGEAAGGDKRGKQSAALRIQGPQPYPELDIRVDDHPDPLPELRRLYDRSLERFQPFVACLASREDPCGETDRARIEERVARFHAARRGAG